LKNQEGKTVQDKRMTLLLGNSTAEELKEIKQISSHSTARAIIIQAIHIFYIILKARKEGYRKLQLINPDDSQVPPQEIIVC